MAYSPPVASVFREAVVRGITVGIGVAFALAEAFTLLENIYSCGSCHAGIAVRPAIASANGLKFAGADFRPGLAGSQRIAAFLGKAVVRAITVCIGFAPARRRASTVVNDVHPPACSKAGIVVGPPIAPAHRA